MIVQRALNHRGLALWALLALVAAGFLTVRALAAASATDDITACAEPWGDGSGASAGLLHRAAVDGSCPAGWTPATWARRGPQGPAGPAGNTGPQGPASAPGPAGHDGRNAEGYAADIEYVSKRLELPTGNEPNEVLACPPGMKAIGAGVGGPGQTDLDKGWDLTYVLDENHSDGMHFWTLRTHVTADVGVLCWRSR